MIGKGVIVQSPIVYKPNNNMSQSYNNNKNTPVVVIPYIGNSDNDKYTAPEKSKVIPIRSYKYQEEENDDDDDDDDDDDNDDNDEQPLTSLAASSSKSASKSTSASTSSDRSPPVAPEYAMVELNGELIAPIEFPPTDTCQSIFGTDRRVELGKFYMDGPEKVPTLIVGSHQLKGKVIKLKDPFCLMEKRYTFIESSDESSSSQPKKKKQKQIESYQIIGIVKEKFHFVTYPKVIMRQFKKH